MISSCCARVDDVYTSPLPFEMICVNADWKNRHGHDLFRNLLPAVAFQNVGKVGNLLLSLWVDLDIEYESE